MTRRMLVGPFSHASHRLDSAFDLACRMWRSGSKRKQRDGDSDHVGEPGPVRLTVTDAVAVAIALADTIPETIPETKPIANVHFSSDGGDISQGHDRRR